MEVSPVTGIKISSVVPATVTGQNRHHELTAMDLVMKLHYVQAVYFFKGTPTGRSFTITDIKDHMFPLLQCYYHVSGRIRMPDDPSAVARPYIRCNDSGIRVVEGSVQEFTVEEWLNLNDRSIDHKFLVYDHVLGPDLKFSPLVYLQITLFKCGGLSLGLSWAHVLGDLFSASAFMNTMGKLISGHQPPKSVYLDNPEQLTYLNGTGDKSEAISIKKIDPVGDYWLSTNKSKMGKLNFHLNLDQINRLVSRYQPFSELDLLYAVIWRSLLNIHGESHTKIITICDRRKSLMCSNEDLLISVVERKDESKIGISELAGLIGSERRQENSIIKKKVEQDKGGSSDFITYGTNLTFVNLDDTDLYDFEVNGEKADFINYSIHGVGDNGVVLIFPKEKSARMVSMVLPEQDLEAVKEEVMSMIT